MSGAPKMFILGARARSLFAKEEEEMMSIFAALSHGVKALFSTGVRLTAPVTIPVVEFVKRQTGCRTYHVESVVVLTTLCMVNAVTGDLANPWRWVETFAVFLTFTHASISQRMEERQKVELEAHGVASVDCFHKLEPVFLGKEALWFIAFLHAELYPALVGVCVFLAYYPWRDEWRKRHPVTITG